MKNEDDKELMAMCNCPEIYEKLHGKVGRVVRFRTFRALIIPTGKERDMDSIASLLPETLAVRTHCKLDQDLTIIELGLEPCTDKGIIEPRIEDVLEWLMADGVIRMARALEEVYHFIGIGGFWDDPVINSAIRRYMAEQHNKHWKWNTSEPVWVKG